MTTTQEINQALEVLSNYFFPPHEERKYWLIRTLGGSLYNKFVENNVVALVHDDLSYTEAKPYLTDYKGNLSKCNDAMKRYLIDKYLSIDLLIKSMKEKTTRKQVEPYHLLLLKLQGLCLRLRREM